MVERHADTSRDPRARGINFRTMELLRVAGLEPELTAQGGDFKGFAIIVAESVMGRELRKILPRGSFNTSQLSPAMMSHVAQDRIEPILRRHAQALGADVRYPTLPVLPPKDATGLLEERCRRIELEIEQYRRLRKLISKQSLPRLFLIESEYRMALRKAELQWTRKLVADIHAGSLEGMETWAKFHESSRPVVQPAPDGAVTGLRLAGRWAP